MTGLLWTSLRQGNLCWTAKGVVACHTRAAKFPATGQGSGDSPSVERTISDALGGSVIIRPFREWDWLQGLQASFDTVWAGFWVSGNFGDRTARLHQWWKLSFTNFWDTRGYYFGGFRVDLCSRRCVSLLRTRCRAHAALGDLQRAVRDAALADKLTRRDLWGWEELLDAFCDSNLAYNNALDHTGESPSEPPPSERRSPTRLEWIRRGQGAQWGLLSLIHI